MTLQPNPEDYGYDLERALASVVGVHTHIPEDAFTAEALGTERAGSGVLVGKDGLVLTIGYLVMEAETVWISLSDGHTVPGHVLGFDPETGFGLVQVLARLDLPLLALGSASKLTMGERLVVAGSIEAGGAVAAHLVARQEFAGYWEYLIEDALFTAPAHPNWGGTALIGPKGDVVGIGSLAVQHESRGNTLELNMAVPIDLLKPVIDEVATLGRANRPARPWLGLYARELSGHVAIIGVASRGPAMRAGLAAGDIVLAVGEKRVATLASFFRAYWGLGEAGVEVPLTIQRDSATLTVRVRSGDRRKFLKGPVLH